MKYRDTPDKGESPSWTSLVDSQGTLLVHGALKSGDIILSLQHSPWRHAAYGNNAVMPCARVSVWCEGGGAQVEYDSWRHFPWRQPPGEAFLAVNSKANAIRQLPLPSMCVSETK